MDNYILDKRKLKKYLTKYGMMFLCLFPILLLVNVALQSFASSGVRTLLLVLIAGILVASIELVILKMKQAKQAKESREVIVVKTGKQKRTYISKTVNKNNSETKDN